MADRHPYNIVRSVRYSVRIDQYRMSFEARLDVRDKASRTLLRTGIRVGGGREEKEKGQW